MTDLKTINRIALEYYEFNALPLDEAVLKSIAEHTPGIETYAQEEDDERRLGVGIDYGSDNKCWTITRADGEEMTIALEYYCEWKHAPLVTGWNADTYVGGDGVDRGDYRDLARLMIDCIVTWAEEAK